MTPTRPNIIVFLTDDMGYGDLSCMGTTDFRTPNLDRMAADGVRFTSWYSNAPVCSPSRASLLTGRYPVNAGVRSILGGERTATGLPPEVPTLASLLKSRGYQCYMSGKWHLGLAKGSRPEDHGFDHWFGHMAGCVDYFSHIYYWGMNNGPGVNPIHDLWEDGEEVWDNGHYLTTAIVKKAVEYIRKATSEKRPFFLYVPFNAPHYPMHAPKESMDRFVHLPPDRQVMAAMISAVDDGVGEIFAELGRQGVEENTLSIFTSDNGPSRESRNWLDGNPDPYYGGSAGGLRGHKFSLFEGGIRMPAILKWPAGVAAGQVIHDPVASMDVVPTVMELTGQPAKEGLDGNSLLPLLGNLRSAAEREIYWEMGGQTALRKGPWKLVHQGQLVENERPVDGVFLSNLEEDPGETINLASKHPELCRELLAKALHWREHIEARWASRAP